MNSLGRKLINRNKLIASILERTLQLIQKIFTNGPVSFQKFMEICLYDSELGYYNSKVPIIGKEGDFFTSSTFSPIFGAVIGKQLEEMWRLMGEPAFTIAEYGAGTGALCQSILGHLKLNDRMYETLRYCIIEKSFAMRAQEKLILNEKVEWMDSIKDIDKMQGCILSNEVLDNFAVYRVVMQKELMEVFVNYDNGFAEELRPASAELKNYLLELGIELPQGYQTEINLEALEWLRDIAAVLEKGYVLTIDYGYLNSEMYKASRNQGTLMCYHKHKVHDAIYENIGEQDLTTHVNFSALIHWGVKNGLVECGFSDQFQFLISLGFRQALLDLFTNEKDVVQASRKFAFISQTLLMDMGKKYRVLAQSKGMGAAKLSGFANTSPQFPIEY